MDPVFLGVVERAARKLLDAAGFKDAVIVFDETTLEMRKEGDEPKKADYKLNPAAKPKEIDIMPDGDANKTMKAIYQLDGDTLKICLPAGDDRPTEVTGAKGSKNKLMVLQRAK